MTKSYDKSTLLMRKKKASHSRVLFRFLRQLDLYHRRERTDTSSQVESINGRASPAPRPPLVVAYPRVGRHPCPLTVRPVAAAPSPPPSSATAYCTTSSSTTTMTCRPVVWWLRQDLRVLDNPTLHAALGATGSRPVVPVFVWSPEEESRAAASPAVGVRETALAVPGGATRLWLHHALANLDADLRESYGARIVFMRGPYAQALREACAAVDAVEIHCSKRYEPAQMLVDDAVGAELRSKHGVNLTTHDGFLIRDPGSVRLDMGKWVGHFGRAVYDSIYRLPIRTYSHICCLQNI